MLKNLILFAKRELFFHLLNNICLKKLIHICAVMGFSITMNNFMIVKTSGLGDPYQQKAEDQDIITSAGHPNPDLISDDINSLQKVC